ncbi:MAG TPA: hypothetical protein VHM48_14040 [Candidatus Limnocylindrales bacterium]|nr:hypothetical protein [Candidatus Limnocylindrales bacterium]
MDAADLAAGSALAAIAVAIGWFILGSLGRAADSMATLFVPPDRTLGWPRGVQESDEPWGWRAAARSADDPTGPDGLDDEDWPTGLHVGPEPPRGTFVVAVMPVAPIRLVVRPH